MGIIYSHKVGECKNIHLSTSNKKKIRQHFFSQCPCYMLHVGTMVITINCA